MPPLVAHVINHLSVGGLENGLVNLINWMPEERFRHVIICVTEFDDFKNRLHRDVPIVALHKRPGKDLGVYRRFWRALREIQPDIVHTRNISCLEFLVPARVFGVGARIHGEHGREVGDLDGTNRKYQLIRKAMRPFVSRYVAVSRDLADWLVRGVGARERRVSQIYNGVDGERFRPRGGERARLRELAPDGFLEDDSVVIGTVGRLQAVKDQTTLARAFVRAVSSSGGALDNLRLVIVGDGPLEHPIRDVLRESGLERRAWLAGRRSDVPELLSELDVFVLPSIAEGISNTILEAMSCGLPVVATAVGGNPELVINGETGTLVPAADPEAMAEAIRAYAGDSARLSEHGDAGRRRIEERFSMERMVDQYMEVYDTALAS